MGFRTRALEAIAEAKLDLERAHKAILQRDSHRQEALVNLSNAIQHAAEAVGEIGEQCT